MLSNAASRAALYAVPLDSDDTDDLESNPQRDPPPNEEPASEHEDEDVWTRDEPPEEHLEDAEPQPHPRRRSSFAEVRQVWTRQRGVGLCGQEGPTPVCGLGQIYTRSVR